MRFYQACLVSLQILGLIFYRYISGLKQSHFIFRRRLFYDTDEFAGVLGLLVVTSLQFPR